MMEQFKKSVILTSKENFSWWSMQEIIPGICEQWQDSAHQERHHVVVLDVDQLSLKEILKSILDADTIVVTCFTVKLARLIQLFRKELKIDARLVIYLHNQATIGCWPLHTFGMGEVLRSTDVFISSCKRDAELLKRSFVNPRVEIVPFSLGGQADFAVPDTLQVRNTPTLAYVGRISSQKNLHTLLFSLWLLRQEDVKFHLEIFGGEDHLGSPNMGLEFKDYRRYLETLCSDLNLAANVEFRGFLPREQMHVEMDRKPYLLVSPSIHSDENFGMAAFRALCSGRSAVLSDWGGHADFGEHFPGSVHYVSVRGSSHGPFIAPRELADVIKSALDTGITRFRPNVPGYFSRPRIAACLRKLGLEPIASGSPLLPTSLATELIEKRNQFLNDSPRGCKIFSSYLDTNSNPFFVGYGMKTMSQHTLLPPACLVPWAKASGKQLLISDPHRGVFYFDLEAESPDVIPVYDTHREQIYIDRRQALFLKQNGWLTEGTV